MQCGRLLGSFLTSLDAPTAASSPSRQQLGDGGPLVAVDLMSHEDGVVLLGGEGALRGGGEGGGERGDEGALTGRGGGGGEGGGRELAGRRVEGGGLRAGT